jgi:hypothetical protein
LKKYFYVFLLFIFSSFICTENFEYKFGNNYKILSSFCEYEKDHINTGIRLISKDDKYYSIYDGEVVFFNKNRLGSIKYNNENFLVIENKEKKLRFNYFNIKNEFLNKNQFLFKKGEEIGKLNYNDQLKESNFYIEVEDIENNRILNPLNYISINDTIPPQILDIYFITDDNQVVSLRLKGEYKVKRGGKVFIKCFDKINNSNYNIVPYSIKLLIDGIEKAYFTFDNLNKKNSYFTINKDREFQDIYFNKEPFDFYIIDYYGLPGLIGFKVIIEDFNGNKSVFMRNLKILPPDIDEEKNDQFLNDK